jgi:hypothetical protein
MQRWSHSVQLHMQYFIMPQQVSVDQIPWSSSIVAEFYHDWFHISGFRPYTYVSLINHYLNTPYCLGLSKFIVPCLWVNYIFNLYILILQAMWSTVTSSAIIKHIIQCWTQYKHSSTLWMLLYIYLYNQLLLAYLIHIISVTILPLLNNDWCNIQYLHLATLLYVLILWLLKSCLNNLFLQPDDGFIAKTKTCSCIPDTIILYKIYTDVLDG